MKPQEREELLLVLKTRFEKNLHRHKGVAWTDIRTKLERNLAALKSQGHADWIGGQGTTVESALEDCLHHFMKTSAIASG